MAIDKAVDSAVLDAGLTATANAIRGKTGDSALIEWKNADGFKDAVDAIPAGGGGGGFPNGTKWYKSNITSGTFHDIVHANGMWVAAGYAYGGNKGLFYSADGMTWVQSNITSGLYSCNSIKYADGIWVVANNEGLYYSSDGMTWTQGSTNSDLSNLIYANGLWVATGSQNVRKYSCYSMDGKTWNKFGSLDNYDAVYYANGIWVVGDGSGLCYSSDGKTWNKSNITDGMFGRNTSFPYKDYIVHGNGIWIAKRTGSSTNRMYYSADGASWIQNDHIDIDLDCIRYVDGIFFASGPSSSRGLYCSIDGMEWTQSNITDTARCLVYKLNGIFIGLDNYYLYHSVDGINWVKSNAPSAKPFYGYNDCCYANGVWIASSGTSNSNLLYSTDGMAWTQSDVDSDKQFYTIRNANGMWVVGSNSGLYYSPTWLPS